MNFWIKFFILLMLFRIVLGVLGHFVGDIIQSYFPPPARLTPYPSMEAAKAAAYRGQSIANIVEEVVFFISLPLIYFTMKADEKSHAEIKELETQELSEE